MRQIPFGKPIIGDEERAAVASVLEGTMFVHGPRGKQFEADFAAFTGAPHALSMASCTAGLHLAWFDLGIGPGDEVIVPAQTHTATAHAVEYTGAKPVFVDCDPLTGNIDISGVEAAVTENTRGICVVHYLGLPVKMDPINAIAAKHDLFVLEDCALSIGATYKGVHTGLLGDAGAFSFYPVKHMTTAEGGMFITKHAELAERIGKKRAFGVDRVVGERKVPGIYDVTMLGYNYRMNELEAALGIEQLKRMNGFLVKRRENYEALSLALSEVAELTVLASGDDGDCVGSFYCLSVVLGESLIDKRFELVEKLKEKGVGTSVYYPKPVPHMSYYSEKYGHDVRTFANAARISYGSIALPVGPHLGLDDVAYISEAMKQSISEVK
ncbi:MAG: DegT/DnrJ/EryC1/StrS family aminotransferase [Pseudodesulfovibrio sp.]